MGKGEKAVDGQRRWLASSRWAAAAQFALAVSLTSSQNDLQCLEMEDENSILKKTKDAVITLRGVLEGKHDKVIEESLDQYQVSRDGWWSALYRMVEGTIEIPGSIIHLHEPLSFNLVDIYIHVFTKSVHFMHLDFIYLFRCYF